MSLQTGSCDSATITLNGTLTYQDGQGFGQGSIPIHKLIGVTGLECGTSGGATSLQGVYLGLVRSAFSGKTINGYLAEDSQSNFVAIAPDFALYTGRFTGSTSISSTITATPVAGVSLPSGRTFNASGNAKAGDFVAASYSGSGDSGSINMFWLGASNRPMTRATLAGTYSDADLGQGFTGQIASGGQLTGSDAAGCQFSGQLPSAITNPFDVVIQVPSCLGAGTYSGKVIVTDWFAAGDNRALVVGLQGPGGALASILIR